MLDMPGRERCLCRQLWSTAAHQIFHCARPGQRSALARSSKIMSSSVSLAISFRGESCCSTFLEVHEVDRNAVWSSWCEPLIEQTLAPNRMMPVLKFFFVHLKYEFDFRERTSQGAPSSAGSITPQSVRLLKKTFGIDFWFFASSSLWTQTEWPQSRL